MRWGVLVRVVLWDALWGAVGGVSDGTGAFLRD